MEAAAMEESEGLGKEPLGNRLGFIPFTMLSELLIASESVNDLAFSGSHAPCPLALTQPRVLI